MPLPIDTFNRINVTAIYPKDTRDNYFREHELLNVDVEPVSV